MNHEVLGSNKSLRATVQNHVPTDLAMGACRFDPILQILPSLIPDGFIYLRAQPETCLKRLQVTLPSAIGLP